jgi:hypothetical protein
MNECIVCVSRASVVCVWGGRLWQAGPPSLVRFKPNGRVTCDGSCAGTSLPGTCVSFCLAHWAAAVVVASGGPRNGMFKFGNSGGEKKGDAKGGAPSWKKKYEEEARSKFNLLLQVQEQQRIIQEQRKIIDELKAKVKVLGATPHTAAHAASSASTVAGSTAAKEKRKSAIKSPVGRILNIHTSGFEVNARNKSASPDSRSAPVSPADGSERRRRHSSSLAHKSPTSSATTVTGSVLSPGLKAANLEFGRRSSFAIETRADWLTNQRVRASTSVLGPAGDFNLCDDDGGLHRKQRSMTLDDARLFAQTSSVGQPTKPAVILATESANPQQESKGSFEKFFVSGLYPTTIVNDAGCWQPDVIFQRSPAATGGGRGGGPDCDTLVDFAFPEGVQTFYVEDALVDQTKRRRDRHCFMLTDSNQVYHGFCLTVNHVVHTATKDAEKQFFMYDDHAESAAPSKTSSDGRADVIISSPGRGMSQTNIDVNADELEGLLDDLGHVGDGEPPTPFVRPDISNASHDAVTDLQKARRIKFTVPDTLPANRVVTVSICDTSCQFMVPQSAAPGSELTVELPIVVQQSEPKTEPVDADKSSADPPVCEALGDACVTNASSPVRTDRAPASMGTTSRASPERVMSGSFGHLDEPENWNKTLFVQRTYCFVAKEPAYELHFQLLERLAWMDQVCEYWSNGAVVDHRAVLDSLCSLLDQYQGFSLADDESIILVRPKLFSKMMAPVDMPWPFQFSRPPASKDYVNTVPPWVIIEAFRRVSYENMITILSILLTERSVAVVSSNPTFSYAITYALTALLNPFEWQATFIPCLPCRMWNFLLAPVPFLVGLTSVPDDIEASIPEVTFLLVDRDEIKNPGSITLPQHTVIDSTELSALQSTLLAEVDLEGNTSIFMDPQATDNCFHLSILPALRSVEDFVRGIIGDVRVHCIRNIDSGDSSASFVFLRDSYLERRNAFISGGQGLFVRRFIDTQMFTVYVDRVMEDDEV